MSLHKSLLWVALFAFLAFILSALTHPIMVWTGPQAKNFRPPTMSLNGEAVQKIPELLQASNIDEAAVVKVVPTMHGNLLQVTPKASSDNHLPREYIDLDSGERLEGFDQEQAKWLARYYTGLSEADAPIKSVEFITEFSNDYPWVNRLIPVYKITFGSSDKNDQNLSAYVYTETNALAGLNNDWKQSLQAIFQTFHTWAWLDDYPVLRVGIILVLLLNVLAMLMTGLVLLLKIRRKKYKNASQRLHRGLAWVVWLPLFGFTVSGLYHLLQYELVDNVRGMRLGSSLVKGELLSEEVNGTLTKQTDLSSAFQSLATKKLNSFSLIRHEGNNGPAYFYRASLAKEGGKENGSFKPHAHHQKPAQVLSANQQRNKRFDGINREQGALYMSVVPGNELNDERYSRDLALKYLGLENAAYPIQINVEKVTRFGPDYDFRNKRLPVYKVSLDTDDGDRVFIDPVTGIVVDHLKDIQRYEGLSFSLLHKWNFMMAFADRQQRDITIVVFLVFMLVLAGLGVAMRFK